MKTRKNSPITITEKIFTGHIIEMSNLMGWKCYHTWQSLHSTKGFPDLAMVRGDRLIFAELKTEKGKLTIEQQAWLDILALTGKCEVYLWRPRDWDKIAEVLS